MNTLKKLCLILFFLSSSAQAVEEVWKLGSKFIPLSQNAEKQWLISLHCEKKQCDAIKALKEISLKLLSPGDLIGGKNPGAVLCHKLPKAGVIFMYDLQGNQNSFCQFEDGSMVSSSTMVIYAEKNDKK